MFKKKKNVGVESDVVETTDDVMEDELEDQEDMSVTVSEDVVLEGAIEPVYAEEPVEEPIENTEEEVEEPTVYESLVQEKITYEPLVFVSEPVKVSTPEPVKVHNDENLSVILNGQPVAKSFVLNQMANNHTIKILEVRPNAYISYKIKG